MPQVASKTFEFKEAPRPNGRCKFYIYGYPKGKREVVWFRTEKDAKKEMKLRNDQITAFGVNAMVTGEEARILNDNVARLAEIGESRRSIYTAVDEYIARRKAQGKSITVEELCNRVVAYYDNLLSEDPTQSGNVAMVRPAPCSNGTVNDAGHVAPPEEVGQVTPVTVKLVTAGSVTSVPFAALGPGLVTTTV